MENETGNENVTGPDTAEIPQDDKQSSGEDVQPDSEQSAPTE